MVGQCLFCSWYGIRLRRAPFLDGGRGLYHLHCARVALQSPDPADRALEAPIPCPPPRAGEGSGP